MATDENTDWFSFWIRFIFGSLFGAVTGFIIWARPGLELYDSWVAGFICTAGGAFLGGVVAGYWRDDWLP